MIPDVSKTPFIGLARPRASTGHHPSQHILISDPIPKESNLISLNMWLMLACLTHGISFTDTFSILCIYKDHFKPDGLHSNTPRSRHLGPTYVRVLGWHLPESRCGEARQLLQITQGKAPSHTPPHSPINLVKAAMRKLGQIDELLNSNTHRHHSEMS